jgi:alpha-acetolactate decarboxylase
MDQRDLVKAVRKYRNYDDELKTLNTKVYKLREDKKFVEIEMGDILRRANFQNLHKLEIQDDGSYIKIQRPETWSKPWSLSQKELKDLTASYFASRTAQTLTADGMFQWIVEHKKRDMVAREFSFKRVMNVDTNDGEDDNNAEGGRVGSRVDA